ncbi:hypothetical protein C8Q79DRAFT_1005967 [Trametes meyenii]|nr:hypothetical protein C8Q79DRAFT_1005967 [Trametes meyenii]
MESFRRDEWFRQQHQLATNAASRDPSTGPIHYNTERFLDNTSLYPPVANVAVFLVIVLNLVHHLSFPGCHLLLQTIKMIIGLLCSGDSRSSLSPYTVEMTIASIPTDLATARNRFPLDPEYTLYACCPLCFALHPSQAPVPTEATEKDEHPLPPDLIGVLPPYIPPQPRRDSRSPLRFPDKCQYQATRTSTRCGTKLLRQGIDSRRPIRTYVHQSLVSWLGRLLIRPDIEHHLDASQANVGPNPSGSVEDILESREVLNFMSLDGQPFPSRRVSEGPRRNRNVPPGFYSGRTLQTR